MPKTSRYPQRGLVIGLNTFPTATLAGARTASRSCQIASTSTSATCSAMGVTILDASDPRHLKPVNFFTAGQYTRTHHLQSSDDLLLVANGANIVAMQSYSDQRGYFENSLAESITKRKNFRSGLSIHDISKPGEMREIAFLEMPGLGVNRLSWMGGRYAY